MIEAIIKKWGNSFGIIIPCSVMSRERLHEGDTINIDIMPKKRIDGFGIFKGGPRFQEEDIGHKEFL